MKCYLTYKNKWATRFNEKKLQEKPWPFFFLNSLTLLLLLDWSGWENKTQCVANQRPCGKGSIYRTRNCTVNDTNYPNDQDECEKQYPGEIANETIDCFVPCYGNVVSYL